MEKIYVFGHRVPDTASVTAAITLANLKNKQGLNASPRVLGDINSETNFVLNYFGFPQPEYLNDVKLQIKDINYQKNYFIIRMNQYLQLIIIWIIIILVLYLL